MWVKTTSILSSVAVIGFVHLFQRVGILQQGERVGRSLLWFGHPVFSQMFWSKGDVV